MGNADAAAATATDDAQLVRRFAHDGEEQAFRTLFRRHTPRLYALALRLSGWSWAEADDVVQETWIRAADRLAGFEGRSRLSTWLAGIAVNVHRERHRRASPHRDAQVGRGGGPGGGESTTGRGNDDRIALEQAIAALSAGYRRVLVLHDVEGFTHAEIAQLLAIDEGTSKSQLGKARRRMRELLAGELEARTRQA